jgi:hypothetical protein
MVKEPHTDCLWKIRYFPQKYENHAFFPHKKGKGAILKTSEKALPLLKIEKWFPDNN